MFVLDSCHAFCFLNSLLTCVLVILVLLFLLSSSCRPKQRRQTTYAPHCAYPQTVRLFGSGDGGGHFCLKSQQAVSLQETDHKSNERVEKISKPTQLFISTRRLASAIGYVPFCAGHFAKLAAGMECHIYRLAAIECDRFATWLVDYLKYTTLLVWGHVDVQRDCRLVVGRS